MKKILLVSLIVAGVIFGGFNKSGTTAAVFLKIGVGRATGMGEAFTGLADDASAVYWNPAGISFLQNREVMLTHNDWAADVYQEFVSAVIPTGWGVVGFSASYVGMGSIDQTQIDNPLTKGYREDLGDLNSTVSASDLWASITYSRLVTDRLSFGANVKYVQSQIWQMTSSGIAFDIGLLYKTSFKNITLGIAINHFGPDVSFRGRQLQYLDSDTTYEDKKIPVEVVTAKDPLPTLFRFGLSIPFGENFLMAIDVVHPSDINETVNIGFEYSLKNFSLRGGYIFNTDLEYQEAVGYLHGLTAGAGFSFKIGQNQAKLDYNYRSLGYLGMSHRVGLSLAF